MKAEFIPPHKLLPHTYSAEELLTADLPPRELVVDPIIASHGLSMIYGPRGLGKTFMALGIAWAAAAGDSFLKWRATRPHRVLYVDGEMPAADMRERLRLLGSTPKGLNFIMSSLTVDGIPDLGHPNGRRLFELCWARQPELLVLDNLSSLVGWHTNDPDNWNGVQDWLLRLRRRGVSVLIVHHAGKDGRQRGSSKREDVLDIVLGLRRPADYEPNQGARFEVHFEKARGLFGDVTDPFEARLQTDGVGVARWQWQPLHVGEFERALPLFKAGYSLREAAAELGMSKSSCHRLHMRAAAMGLLESAHASTRRPLA